MAKTKTVFDVANYFLQNADYDDGDAITNLKLQKLVYYAQAWHLALCGKKLFSGRFEAWAHGPVCPELYRKCKEYGHDAIPQDALARLGQKRITGESLEILEEVLEVYGQFSASRLRELTHNEDPWKEARGDCSPGDRCNSVISEETMREYYRALADSE